MIGVRNGALLLALAELASTAAMAQQRQGQSSSFKGHDANAPVDMNADRCELQERADRAICTGKVHVVQADMTLDTPRLTVAYASSSESNNGNPKIERLDAAGGVIVKSSSETASGEFGVYDLNRKLITLIGNVHLAQRQNTVNGARLVIDLNTGRSVIDGGPQGVDSTGGRVSGHFVVPRKNTNGSRHEPQV